VTSTTQVRLSKGNFRLIRANAIGESTGFNLLGLISFKDPEYAEAITRMYRQAGISGGRAETFVNVVYDRTSTVYLLFSLPKITVRGDLVEFREGGQPGAESHQTRAHGQQDQERQPSGNPAPMHVGP
jgi:hypothetical protein